MEDDQNITYISTATYDAMMAGDDQKVPEAHAAKAQELRAKYMNPAREFQRAKIVAYLEECGGDYDLRYSASISKLADDLLRELQ